MSSTYNNTNNGNKTNHDKITESPDEVSILLNRISNKYTGNALMKDLNQMYDVGIMMANKKFDKEKLVNKLTKIIDIKSDHPIKEIRFQKKKQLLEALQNGINDGSSDEYRLAYDSAGRYQYSDREKLKVRGRIDAVLDNHRKS